MNPIAQKNGGYTANKNEMIMLEGRKAASLNLLLQGKLDVFITPSHSKYPASYNDLAYKSYRLFELEQNIFIGAAAILLGGRSNLTVSAASECSLFAYDAADPETAWSVIYAQKDYGAYIINSICSLICNSYQCLQKTWAYCHSIDTLCENLCAFYAVITDEYGLETISGKLYDSGSSHISQLKNSNTIIPVYFSKQFAEAGPVKEASEAASCPHELQDDVTYYEHMYNLSGDLKKAFFAADQFITGSHIMSASKCLEQVVQKLRHAFSHLEKAIEQLYGDHEENLYKAFQNAAGEMYAKRLDYGPALEAASYIFRKLGEIASFIELEYGHKTGTDFKYLEHDHATFTSSFRAANDRDNTSAAGEITHAAQSLPEELTDSALKILEYSGLPEGKTACFMMNLVAFRNLKDRLSADDASRQIRNAIAGNFFEIYDAVFRKAYRLKEKSRLIRMFLNYGYMDENLLDNGQVLEIYKIAGMENTLKDPNVSDITSWLAKIYEMEKEPSINHFGQDYFDIFREMKKRGQADEKDKAVYNNDTDARLTFEINNMFRTNHRLCQGQLQLYFPILHRDMAPASPLRSHITPALVKEKLSRILDIDYSAFHREINYRDPSKGIEKEIVMMSVVPDFILMPVYGSRAIMWQEIAGRVRSAPGRILLPIFTDENLDDLLVKMIGNFKWELCRTMMGTAWNDVTQSSLTSEYTDYTQFYRKNRDLTDEAKERVKSLISKYQNRMRDIFTSDYELWINYESRGNPRLNKVARGILFKHCPFSKEIRENLERQPMYADLIAQMKHQRLKQVKDLENRYKHYLKANNGALDTTLENNLIFYRDM